MLPASCLGPALSFSGIECAEGRKLEIMTDSKYAAFRALDPFFNIVQQGLAGLVDGDHYFDTIADDAVFEFRYILLAPKAAKDQR
jgi:hypothetical protein